MADHEVKVTDGAGRDMIAERIMEKKEKYAILKTFLLKTSTLNGGFSNDILGFSQDAYDALEKLVTLEVVRNTPQDGLRVTNLAEILSLTIAQDMSEYSLV